MANVHWTFFRFLFLLANLMSDSDHETLLEDPNPDILLKTTSTSGSWHRSARIALCGGFPPDKSDFLLSQLKDRGITPTPGLHLSQLRQLAVQAFFCDPAECTLLPIQDACCSPTGPPPCLLVATKGPRNQVLLMLLSPRGKLLFSYPFSCSPILICYSSV